MTTRRTTDHATFTVSRTYAAPAARVFAAWADPALKSRWFGAGAQGAADPYALDFRVGGREHLSMSFPEGPSFSFDATYQDIVRDERIVYTYDMHRGTDRISVSVATVEFLPEGTATTLRVTEQGVFLDGHDQPTLREQGTRELLESIAAVVEA